MRPFVCYYDTESKLTSNNDIKNATHKHEIVSYKYIIVDKDNVVKARKIETGGNGLGERMIKNILSDFKQVRKELESKWILTPKLTSKDEV